ncbi:MAG: MFS transporter [Paludibacter sp.]|nr:MFS transporter [Paludibacter sp.]
MRRTGVFWAVTIGYGLFYVTRLSLNVLKKSIVDENLLTESELGMVGSALFFTYALGKLVNGFLADRMNIRYFMAISLLICSIANFALGFQTAFWMFLGLWTLNGWFQSTGAASSIIALKRWYPPKRIGTVYGFWSASHNIGEAITFTFTAFVVGALGWQWGFFSAGFLGLLGVVLIFFLLTPRPTATADPLHESLVVKQGNIGLKQLEVLKNPMIWMLAVSSAFMYIARYAVNSWGIFYFEIEKGYTILEASSLISISSIFGIFGTIFSGLFSDKFFKGSRTIPAILMSALNLFALLLFLLVPAGYYYIDIVSMVLFGISIGVLICFLGGLMAVDIAPKQAVGAAAGVIGIASYIAAGIQDIVSGFLIEGKKTMVDGVNLYDFDNIRYFWIIAAALSLTFLIFIAGRHKKAEQKVKDTEEE